MKNVFHFEIFFFCEEPNPPSKEGGSSKAGGTFGGGEMINTTGGTENCRTGTEIRPEFLYTFFLHLNVLGKKKRPDGSPGLPHGGVSAEALLPLLTLTKIFSKQETVTG